MERLFYKLGDQVDEKKARHIKRYDMCAADLKKYGAKTILDFGCGSGYGSKLLALAMPEAKIISYDISEEALEFAKKNNNAENISYVNEIPADVKFDGVLLIDMIEHMTDEETEKQLSRIKQMSVSKVRTYISTPFQGYDGPSGTNKFHINMYTRERFESLLHSYYSTVELWLMNWNFHRKMTVDETIGNVVAICEGLK